MADDGDKGTKDDARMRDLLGRATSKIEELEERLALVEEYGMEDPGTEDVGSPPPANPNQPYPGQMYNPSPVPYPVQGQGGLESMGYVHLMYNPTTKDVQPIPVAGYPGVAPQPPRQTAPVQVASKKPTGKAKEPTMTKDDYLKAKWEREFSSLADDLQFHNKMHPKAAEKLAADIVREAVPKDNLSEVLRTRSKDDKLVQTVLRERIRLDAEVSGLTEAQKEDDASKPPVEESEDGEPFEIDTIYGTEQPLMQKEGDEESEDIDAQPEQPPKSTSTTPSTPPSAATSAPSPIKTAKALTEHINQAFSM